MLCSWGWQDLCFMVARAAWRSRLNYFGEAWTGRADSSTSHSSCVCALTWLPAWEIPVWEWVSRKWVWMSSWSPVPHLLSTHCLHLSWGWWHLLCRPLVMLQNMFTWLHLHSWPFNHQQPLEKQTPIPLSPQAMITKASHAWGLKWQKGLAQSSEGQKSKTKVQEILVRHLPVL